jgi:AGZA family xanthine/uracil permease-like MFS transporter
MDLENAFGIRRAGSTVRREVLAGLATFATLSYILFVQPAVLSNPACGMDAGGVLFATCVASAVACFLMAWWSNLPVALAPAMGHNFFFVFTVCAQRGFTWQEALAANCIAGLLFVGLSVTRFRESVMHAVPDHLKYAIAAGIGLLIATIGLEWSGIVVAHPATYVTLGDLRSPVALLALFGLALTAVLLVLQVTGAFLFGILATAAAGWIATQAFDLAPALVRFEGVVGAPPSPAGTAFHLEFAGLFARPLAAR